MQVKAPVIDRSLVMVAGVGWNKDIAVRQMRIENQKIIGLILLICFYVEQISLGLPRLPFREHR